MTFSVYLFAQKSIFQNPPGTIQINDSLFIDNVPVDNLMYQEFTSSLKEKWNLKIHDSLKDLQLREMDLNILTSDLFNPDDKSLYEQVVYSKELNLPDDITTFEYYNFSIYKYHPVIGTSKEQAELFCKWRTDMVNLRWSSLLKNDTADFNKIEYRIPKKEEFRLARKRFSKQDSYLKVAKQSPLKLNLKDVRQKKLFFETSYPEYLKDENPAKNEDYVMFRCICEVKD